MKVTTYVPKAAPKSKESALRLAAQTKMLLDSMERKRKNLENLKNQHLEKIAKLKSKLQLIEEDLKNLDPTGPLQVIEDLKLRHSLTEAEILEVRSSLLRQSIEGKQRQLDMLQAKEEKHLES